MRIAAAFNVCTLLLVCLAAAASVQAALRESYQSSDINQLSSVKYRGALLNKYRTTSGVKVVEPYVTFDLSKKPEIRRNILGKGFYLKLPLIVDNGVSARSKSSKVLQIDSFKVNLRSSFSKNWCSKGCGDVAVGGYRDAAGKFKVLFRCRVRSVCMRVFDALYFKNSDSELVASAFSFSFGAVAGGSRFTLAKSGLPVRRMVSMPLKNAYWFEGNKVLLYTIKAGSGESAYESFMKEKSYRLPADGSFPEIYRSSLLDNLKAAVRSSKQWNIVAEMRKRGKLLAQVVFDVQTHRNSLNIRNWFSAGRVVSSYPYFIQKTGYNYFSVEGNAHRKFFINYHYGGCPNDAGFWAVLDHRDVCKWGNRGWTGRGPVLVFNTVPRRKYEKSRLVYADQFLIYLRYNIPTMSPKIVNPWRNDFEFEKNKLLLFTIRANSNIEAYPAFQRSRQFKIPRDKSLPTVYRSAFLDNLAYALSVTGKREIVAEMRKNGKSVARVVFDVSDRKVDSQSWFNKKRVVSSSPIKLTSGDKFNYFRIKGENPAYLSHRKRRFLISFKYSGCEGDIGFWAVYDSKEECEYGSKWWRGSIPTLVYSDRKNVPLHQSSRSADRFLIYLQ